MTEALIGLSIGFGGSVLVMIFATHMTLWGDFKYYKQIYESFERGDYKYSKLLDLIYFNYGREEIIFFPDGAIKLTSDVYIHISFIRWFSPYTLYYMWKFNKVKDYLIVQHMRETEIDMWRVVQIKKPFKLLRG
jgi:hypothetical protein